MKPYHFAIIAAITFTICLLLLPFVEEVSKFTATFAYIGAIVGNGHAAFLSYIKDKS